MIINVFKNNNQIFNSLIQYNDELKNLYHKYVIYEPHKTTWWFDPDRTGDEEIKIGFDGSGSLVKQKNLPHDAELYKLFLHVPNYLTILLINTFYSNKKDILIEDACAGMGSLPFYLSKCGYTNFSIIENFSQVSEILFKGIMNNIKVDYVLNDNVNPIVINLSAYTVYPKEDVSDSVELFCIYSNQHLNLQMNKLLLEKKHNYKELCHDHNCISKAYCRKDKYMEFKEKLKPYVI